jgi:hypothetical protein
MLNAGHTVALAHQCGREFCRLAQIFLTDRQRRSAADMVWDLVISLLIGLSVGIIMAHAIDAFRS